MRVHFARFAAVLAMFGGVMTSPLRAEQSPVDRADPAVVEDELRQERPEQRPARPLLQKPAPRTDRSAVTQPIMVGAIDVEGNEALPSAAFAPVIERYVGRTLSTAELRALASEVAGVARAAGYGLATAWIPEQRVTGGLLKINIDEGRIDAVEVRGSGKDAVEPYLRPLADGKPIRTDEVERRLLVADDIGGIRMGKAKLERRSGRNILVVGASRDRVEARAGVDNWGSSTAGPVRARLNLDINGLAAEDDRLSVGGTVTPFQPREFALVQLSYSVALGTGGTELSVGGYVARSEAGGELADRDIDGRSSELEAEIRHPIVRSREGSLWASVAGHLRESSQTREDELFRQDRLATVTAGLFGVHSVGDGRVRGRAALVKGISVFGATESGDPLASRRDADGTFTKLEMWWEVEQRLGRGVSLLAQAEGQAASGPLLSSEEMGLGGRYFGRAWDYREFSGDRGIAGSLELRFDWKRPAQGIKWAQLYAYGDGGAVDNYGLGRGGGSLASSGGGLRLFFENNLRAGFELGVPLTDGADPAEEDKPRFSFTLDRRF